jgi:ABC-type sulfate transport system permease subunit
VQYVVYQPPESDMLTILFAIVLLPLALFLGVCVVAVMFKAFFDGLSG